MPKANARRFACANGVTLDFAQPYELQVRPSEPADRNTRFMPWRYSPFSGDGARMAYLAGRLLGHYEDCARHGRQPDLRGTGIAGEFVRYMRGQ